MHICMHSHMCACVYTHNELDLYNNISMNSVICKGQKHNTF